MHIFIVLGIYNFGHTPKDGRAEVEEEARRLLLSSSAVQCALGAQLTVVSFKVRKELSF